VGGGPELHVEELRDPAQHHALAVLVGEVWPTPGGAPVHGSDIYTALARCGGYVAGAFRGGRLVGGGIGLLASGARLHSHVVAVRPGLEHHGIGYAIKQHQRGWAQANGLGAITWTFDPLVRRNAYFNLAKLGARIVDYVDCYYGSLDDAVNAGDDTDRAVVEWRVDDSARLEPEPAAETCRVATPDDIVSLRRLDIDAAREWRRRVRAELGDRVRDGWVATGMSRDGFYTVERAR
jgi:predicted GNAT superfamily acetyltransferase